MNDLKLNELITAPWYHMDEIPSTNQYLLEIDSSQTPSGTTCSANIQTHGNGRNDRKWHSPVGGLYLSVLFKLCTTEYWNLFPFVCGLAAADAIEHCCPAAHVSLKWPNDLLIDKQKVGGILVQGSIGTNPRLVAGIGINVNSDLSGIPERPIFPAATLNSMVPQAPEIQNLAYWCRYRLFEYFLKWEAQPTFVIAQWTKRSIITNRRITFQTSQSTITGYCRGIDSDGRLLIDTERSQSAFISGDILAIGER